MAEVVRRWAQKVQMQSLRVGLEAGIDQTQESDVEAACAVGSAVVAVAFAGDSCDHLTARTFVHVASQAHFADTVAVVALVKMDFVVVVVVALVKMVVVAMIQM